MLAFSTLHRLDHPTWRRVRLRPRPLDLEVPLHPRRCRREIPGSTTSRRGAARRRTDARHYFNDKVFDFDVMSYWAGVPDACGNTWVGGIIGGDEPVRCAMLHQSGWLNYATSVALEAWDDGRQAWIGVGGASEMTHCPEGMAMCCFGLQGCPYVDAIAVAADAPTTGPISSPPCASPRRAAAAAEPGAVAAVAAGSRRRRRPRTSTQ